MSTTTTTTVSDDNNDDSAFGSLSAQPFAWILIPVVIILFIGLVVTIYRVRKRRSRRGRQWPGQGSRVTPGGNTGTRLGGNRTTAWAGTRSQEGLNELGEAPPPYDGTKDRRDSMELQDLEAGRRPPDYPAEPGPAVIANDRRAD